MAHFDGAEYPQDEGLHYAQCRRANTECQIDAYVIRKPRIATSLAIMLCPLLEPYAGTCACQLVVETGLEYLRILDEICFQHTDLSSLC